MTDSPEVTDDLYRTASAIAREVAAKNGRQGDRHLIEDMAQTLFLAGWQVWRDKGDVGLAKNRMRSRQNNLIKSLCRERNAPPPVSQLSEREQRGAVPSRAMGRNPAAQPPPESALVVEEFLSRQPERRRHVAQLRMAAMTNDEIAKELGISKRMVEREITALKEELKP